MTRQPAWVSDLLDASAADRERLLHSRPKAGLAADVRFLASEVLEHLRVSVERASVLAEAATCLADRQLDPFGLGLSRRALAHVRYLHSSYEEALQLYDEAADSFRCSGDEVEVGKTLSNSLQVRILLGRYEEALTVAAEARRVFEEHDEELYLARLECNVGNLLHRKDRFEEAIDCYERCLKVFRRLAGDPESIAAALLNMGVCRIAIDDFNEALDCFEQLRQHCLEHDLPLAAAQADYNIAYLHHRRGEYTRAIDLYRTAEENCRKSGDAQHRALCCLDLAELYLELRLTKEGIRLATVANESFDELGMGYEASKALVFMALGASQEKRTVGALELLAKAHRGYDSEGNPEWCATIDLYRGLILLDAGRAIEAKRHAESALTFFEERGLAPRIVQCELLMARAQLALGTVDSARRVCASALDRSEQQSLRDLLFQGHFVSGQIEECAGNTEAALEAYRQAHLLLEGGAGPQRSDPLQIAIVQNKLEVYESLVWHSVMERSNNVSPQEVFAIVEDAKARGLAELIAFKPPALPASQTHQSELVMEMRHLRQELNWYSFQITPKTTASPRIVELRGRERECQERLLETLSELRADNRDFFSLQMGGGVDIEAIRASIPADATMLVFYAARGTIFALTLDHHDLQVRPLSTLGKVHEIQRQLQFQLSRFWLGSDHVERFHEDLERKTSAPLRELYAELVGPVRDRLSGDQLIVVPHGSLHNIPFHALLDDDSYLIDDFAVSYAPSASVYQMCCEKPPKPKASRFHIASSGLVRSDNPMFSEIQLADSSVALFDLYQMELSSELVTLTGCGSPLTSVNDGDELICLTRGLLYAGAESVLTTLWDSQSESTAMFLSSFDRELLSLDNRAVAMQRAMLEVRRDFPHPFYWAPFHLSGKSAPAPFTARSVGVGGASWAS